MRLKIFYPIFMFSHENMKIRSFGSRLFFYLFGRKKMARLETDGENSQEPFWRFVDYFYKCDLSQIPSEIIEYQYPIIKNFFWLRKISL